MALYGMPIALLLSLSWTSLSCRRIYALHPFLGSLWSADSVVLTRVPSRVEKHHVDSKKYEECERSGWPLTKTTYDRQVDVRRILGASWTI